MLGKPITAIAISVPIAVFSFVVGRSFVIDQTPQKVMSRIEAQIAERAGGVNICRHNRNYGPRFGSVARANPDSIVTSMSYDVSNGPVELRGLTWPAYWSLSVYQHNTDNIFVVNDRQLEGDAFHVVVVKSGQTVSAPESATVVTSPSNSGIVLVRRFVASADLMPDVIKNQDAMTCGVFTSADDG